MPKAPPSRRGPARRTPLHVDVLDAEGLPCAAGESSEKRQAKRKYSERSDKCNDGHDVDDAAEEAVMPSNLSKKLLRLVEEQQRESESNDHSDWNGSDGEETADADGFVVLDCQEDEEDAAFEGQFGEARKSGVNLADLIMQRLKAADAERGKPDDEQSSSLSPKVVEVYTSMAAFLAHYRSGKIPKAFKIIPRLNSWEDVLVLTNPHEWSKQATRAATKIFCSSLKEAMAQRFLFTILLPAVRDDIAQNKKLNYHLYMALKKALFKPGAFFKGVYLPLALEGCTVREAAIVGSVVTKVSIPVLHGAAALIRLASVLPEMWNPPISHMMMVLIDKKYSLPLQAIDECVNHFHRFVGMNVQVTVAWHKCLLVLVQRYKVHLTANHRAMLKSVLKSHFHEKVGPEIRRELQAQNPALLLEQQQRALRALAESQSGKAAIEVDV